MKTYNKAPLPFQGQKRNFIKKFRETLQKFPDDAIYIDLFGGSGLLSHTIKSIHPSATVIYNDFDKYGERLANVDKTNSIIADIREIVKNVPGKKRIEEPMRTKILKRIKKETGFVDYNTISSNLLFSGSNAKNFEELKINQFYNRVTKDNYKVDGYLEGIEIFSMDYKKIFEKYKHCKNAVFILDPPYLSTDVTTYTNTNYWTLTNYLDILKTIEGRSFIYFTSEKSQIIELMTWLESNKYGNSPFTGALISKTTVTTTSGNSYQDIMIHKKTA